MIAAIARRITLAGAAVVCATMIAGPAGAAPADPFGSNCRAYGTCSDPYDFRGGRVIREPRRAPPVKLKPYSPRYNPGSKVYQGQKVPQFEGRKVPQRGRLSPSHTRWCIERYRSYQRADNSYQPLAGPRKQCVSPFW